MARPPDKFRSRLKQFLGLNRNTSASLSPQLPPNIVVEEPVQCDELLKVLKLGLVMYSVCLFQSLLAERCLVVYTLRFTLLRYTDTYKQCEIVALPVGKK